MIIRQATFKDVFDVSVIEKQIEKQNAASLETLKERRLMFPEGFKVAENTQGIVGYLESCKWDLKDFEKLDQIKDFPRLHTPKGKNVYIIFMGVAESYRREGVGSQMLQSMIDYSEHNGVGEMQLVSDENLVPFYNKLGFRAVRILPNFLPCSPGTLMKKRIKN